MSPHPGTIRDLAHRQRVAAHQAAAYVDGLTQLEPYQRADLRQFINLVAEHADALSPATSATVVETDNVVSLPRRPVVRAFVPVVAIEPEIWR